MKPRLLLVEDDPTTRAFLHLATQALDVEMDLAASMHHALALAAKTRHAAWLLDARLPDGSGVELLAQLRQMHRGVAALVHTAVSDQSQLQRLRDAGFDAAVSKPLSTAAWQAAVRQLLSMKTPPAFTALPLWDNAAALQVLGGHQQDLDALRRLFMQELPAQIDTLERARMEDDHTASHAELHRLSASCSFVGAARLAASLVHWRQCPGTLAVVIETARATLAADSG